MLIVLYCTDFSNALFWCRIGWDMFLTFALCVYVCVFVYTIQITVGSGTAQSVYI